MADQQQRTRGEPTLIRKYANRRLYNTATGSFVTLEGLRDMVVRGDDFVVIDARSGGDITASVLAQIIAEQESRGESLLPSDVLRQVISLYEQGMGSQLSDYLNRSLEGFTRNMEHMQRLGDLGRRNFEIFQESFAGMGGLSRERSATGATRAAGSAGAESGAAPEAGLSEEVRSLRAQLDAMQQRLDDLAGEDDAPRAPGRSSD